jgi:geranylgeranyl diphosphate synthase, type I
MTDMIDTAAVPPVLARARDIVRPAMVDAVERLSPQLQQTAAYHLGWRDENGTPIAGDHSGKGVRPALALLSAEAAGADGQVAVPGAVAVELVHNFSLVHDDIIDGDRERRHRPTVWARHGVGPALILGDALLTLANRVLLDAPAPPSTDEATRSAISELTQAVAAMIAGQADDMAFESRPHITVDECLAMMAGKTGALLACATTIGARLAGAPPTAIEALRRHGTNLGVAFQAVDDLLGIWGDPERTGKPRGSDIAARKKSLPIAFALANSGADAGELRHLLVNGSVDDEAVIRGTVLVEKCGGRVATAEVARRHLDAALDALECPDLDQRARTELAELAHFIVDREF